METRIRLTAEQAAAHAIGHIVLNGDPDSPVTTVVRDTSGNDVRAATQDEAFAVLGNGHRYSHVALIEHEFPDADGGPAHLATVWVPVNPGT